jgi:starvation-inducible outer membrane lipoprotein
MTVAAYLIAFPDGITQPAVSTLPASPDRWRVNNAIVPAGSSGTIDVYCQYAGRVIIDVNGYFAP